MVFKIFISGHRKKDKTKENLKESIKTLRKKIHTGGVDLLTKFRIIIHKLILNLR